MEYPFCGSSTFSTAEGDKIDMSYFSIEEKSVSSVLWTTIIITRVLRIHKHIHGSGISQINMMIGSHLRNSGEIAGQLTPKILTENLQLIIGLQKIPFTYPSSS